MAEPSGTLAGTLRLELKARSYRPARRSAGTARSGTFRSVDSATRGAQIRDQNAPFRPESTVISGHSAWAALQRGGPRPERGYVRRYRVPGTGTSVTRGSQIEGWSTGR